MWVVGGLIAWLLAAVLVGVLIGRGIRLADRRSSPSGVQLADPAVTPARTSRRRIPFPPVGIGLAAGAVALEATGYALRLSGATGSAARALSMDVPYSLPRMYVAALFTAAGVVALAGAARNPGRRTWWLAVGLVAVGIAVVKAGGTLHADAMTALASTLGVAGAVVVSFLVAGATLAVLGFVSRAERRDRRRVLGCLAAYAGASVGLSAISAAVSGRLAITATFLEESGEALAGVSVLVAVLIGVAPRLVLPAAWLLRRETDAQALDVPVRPARGWRAHG